MTIALGVVAVLAGAGGNDLPTGVASTLQDQVAVIRHDVEIGRPGYARADLNELVAMVRSRLDRGLIGEQRATEILAAADGGAARQAPLPRTAPEASPSPSPAEEHDKGKDKDHDKGHGND
jgi:hypothetical protein